MDIFSLNFNDMFLFKIMIMIMIMIIIVIIIIVNIKHLKIASVKSRVESTDATFSPHLSQLINQSREMGASSWLKVLLTPKYFFR